MPLGLLDSGGLTVSKYRVLQPALLAGGGLPKGITSSECVEEKSQCFSEVSPVERYQAKLMVLLWLDEDADDEASLCRRSASVRSPLTSAVAAWSSVWSVVSCMGQFHSKTLPMTTPKCQCQSLSSHGRQVEETTGINYQKYCKFPLISRALAQSSQDIAMCLLWNGFGV